ncbi:MAG TPA: adenylate/guanylate cyclase domain-containing protein [Geminicoccaceae bacterium]|nr:adenylate/guanylate cyclase domain-containing protein [Geminicoccaceae bacterium]
MHDAALSSESSVPVGAGFSLGAKFVGLTAGLILLLSLSAFISLRNSAETVRQIGSVVEFAIPAYGALARSHIRSLEQALELRRSLLLAEDPAASDDVIGEHVQAFLKARTEFHREIADAERLLGLERDSTSSGIVAADLQKLTEALTGLMQLIEVYEQQTDACLAAVSERSLPEARQRLVTIDGLRQELGKRLETMRAGMFTTLKAVSKEAQDAQARARIATMVVFVLASILGLGVAALAAMRVIRSIKYLVLGAEAVEGGNLDTSIQIGSRDEIGRLAASFNRMTEGLRMRDRIRETFGRYVDRRIAEQLIQSTDLLVERGERREVAVMFCDLAGFTALSERVEAEQLVRFLNAHFSLLAREIAATDGIIDKYIGDAVMAYWCPPFVPQDEVALRAADAALLCLGKIPVIAAASREIFNAGAGAYDPRIRIGIASGQSITGSIGAEERRNYTVIGDAANLAARIEGANRLYRTSNLVCGRTAEAIRARFEVREIDTIALPGIDAPQAIFEIVGRAGEVSAEQRELHARYELALSSYRHGDWPLARRRFSDCLGILPGDGPTRTMLKRIEGLATTPAAAGSWSSVWRLAKDDLG